MPERKHRHLGAVSSRSRIRSSVVLLVPCVRSAQSVGVYEVVPRRRALLAGDVSAVAEHTPRQSIDDAGDAAAFAAAPAVDAIGLIARDEAALGAVADIPRRDVVTAHATLCCGGIQRREDFIHARYQLLAVPVSRKTSRAPKPATLRSCDVVGTPPRSFRFAYGGTPRVGSAFAIERIVHEAIAASSIAFQYDNLVHGLTIPSW